MKFTINAEDLYTLLKEALKTFNLSFHCMGDVEILVDDKCLTFKYGAVSISYEHEGDHLK